MKVNEIQVNKNGKLILPNTLEEPVQFVPHDKFKVIVNDNEMTEPTNVTVDDDITIENKVPDVPAVVKVTVSSDKLSAYVQLQPNEKVIPKVSLENSIYGPQAKLIPYLDIQYPFTLQMIQAKLDEKGVVFGIDLDTLKDLLANPHDEKVVVARGTVPKPGVDDAVTLLFSTQGTNQPQILPDGRVDFKQKQISTIDLGEVLAVKLPGQPGKPGIGVDGRDIAPPDYNKIELRAGPKTMLQENGLSVVALESGLPSVTRSKNIWTFQVIPLLEYDEVNMTTGNLDFNGNLRIYKDVAEGMSVFGARNIDIGGSVYSAKVIALGDLSVGKNLISSFASAGGISEYLETIKEQMNKANKRLSELYLVMRAVQKRYEDLGKVINYGQLTSRVINKKFSDLPKIVDELDKIIKKQKSAFSDLKSLVTELVIMFCRLGVTKIKDTSEIRQLQQRVAANITALDALGDSNGDIILSYAINSTIEAAGDVRVSGKGCINTNINTRGNVIIDSIFRGGLINCTGYVKINEAGSEMGAKTVIKTRGKPIQIEKAYPNVVLTAGSNSRTINNTEYKVFLKDLD